MLSDRFITRHTPLEHLLLEPPLIELERELQRRLRGVEDAADTSAPLLAMLEDKGLQVPDDLDSLDVLLDAANDIGSPDGAAKFLRVLKDRNFDGDENSLDGLLQVLDDEGLSEGPEVRRLLDEHGRMRDLLERARDLFEAIDGTNVDNEQLLDEYRALFAEA